MHTIITSMATSQKKAHSVSGKRQIGGYYDVWGIKQFIRNDHIYSHKNASNDKNTSVNATIWSTFLRGKKKKNEGKKERMKEEEKNLLEQVACQHSQDQNAEKI